MVDFILNILTHEFTLTLYGVMLFHIEQCIESKLTYKESVDKIKQGIISSLIWVGFVIAFDDELLSRYNGFANVDYSDPPFFMYILGGFMVDFLRSAYKKFRKENAEA
jgi:hypothetical protein